MTDAHNDNIGSSGRKSARITRYGLLAALGLVLAACGGRGEETEQQVVFESPPAPPTGCPNVSVLAGAESVTQFGPGGGTSPSNVTARGLIGDFEGECTYSENSVVVELDLPIIGATGPAGGAAAAYEYFVAVLSPTNRVLGKEVFVTTVDFGDTGNGAVLEELEQVIPLPNGAATGNRYSILVGFQLTPQQLQYNRAL